MYEGWDNWFRAKFGLPYPLIGLGCVTWPGGKRGDWWALGGGEKGGKVTSYDRPIM